MRCAPHCNLKANDRNRWYIVLSSRLLFDMFAECHSYLLWCRPYITTWWHIRSRLLKAQTPPTTWIIYVQHKLPGSSGDFNSLLYAVQKLLLQEVILLALFLAACWSPHTLSMKCIDLEGSNIEACLPTCFQATVVRDGDDLQDS